MSVSLIFTVSMLFGHSVKLSVFDHQLLVMLGDGKHVLVFNVLLYVLNVYLSWAAVRLFWSAADEDLGVVALNVGGIFHLASVCLDWRRLVALWTGLTCGYTPGYWVRAYLRRRLREVIVTIGILDGLWNLRDKRILSHGVLMFLTFIANFVIFYIVAGVFGLYEKVVLLLSYVTWLD